VTTTLPPVQVGIIGGSGFYEMPGFTDRREPDPPDS